MDILKPSPDITISEPQLRLHARILVLCALAVLSRLHWQYKIVSIIVPHLPVHAKTLQSDALPFYLQHSYPVDVSAYSFKRKNSWRKPQTAVRPTRPLLASAVYRPGYGYISPSLSSSRSTRSTSTRLSSSFSCLIYFHSHSLRTHHRHYRHTTPNPRSLRASYGQSSHGPGYTGTYAPPA
ncbi:hypothetical protein R3P38DRAFT_3200516 [Favolaschia claudopus]|uniref:Uncharacterized protein n=1 Tax=Favolaschia claudopus TaxID=2862362 RepID=A0AAW0AXT9_9AGAR